MIGQILLLATLKSMLVVLNSEQMSGVISSNESNNCSCLGDTLTFECTVLSGQVTLWTGDAFDCSSTSNEIYLHNSSHNDTCNKKMIIGRIIQVEQNFYISQLSVRVSYDLIGKMVQCISISNSGIRENSTVTIDAIISPYPPPEKIFLSLVNFRMKEITFTWSTVTSGCPTVHYNILASNCGSCPTTTNHTTVTCTDVPTDNRMCTFAIRTVVCTNIIGNVSKPLKFNVSETFNKMMHHHSKVSTASLSIFIVGVSALLITVVIVILVCYWLYKQSAAIKTTSRLNETTTGNSDCDSSSSLQSHHATSQQENKDTYEYSQLVEPPVDLKQLLEKLQGQTSKQWYQLGLTLGLPMDVLEGFNLYSEDDCLAEVLDYWLKHHPGKPTWQEITDAEKKVEMFNTEQDTGVDDKKTATASDIPPPKPPRRTSSVIMKKPEISTATNDTGHEYEVIH